jgi:hypothetical protein
MYAYPEYNWLKKYMLIDKLKTNIWKLVKNLNREFIFQVKKFKRNKI